MKRITLMVFLAVAALSAGCHEPDDPLLAPDNGGKSHNGDILFTTLMQGNGSGSVASTRQQIVVTNENEWRNLWDQIHAGITPRPELPQVDFSTNMVAALFQGLHGTGGFKIAAERVTEEDNAVRVWFVESAPESGCLVSMALTSPIHIITFPNRAKPIEFSGSTSTIPCD